MGASSEELGDTITQAWDFYNNLLNQTIKNLQKQNYVLYTSHSFCVRFNLHPTVLGIGILGQNKTGIMQHVLKIHNISLLTNV